MYSARDNEGHLNACLTLIFKVNYGGQATYVSHIEIPNIGYVQIGTNIVSLSYNPWWTRGHNSNSDLDFQGHSLRSSDKFQ